MPLSSRSGWRRASARPTSLRPSAKSSRGWSPPPRTDLARLLTEAAGDVAVRAEGDGFEGDFDAPLLGEALQIITSGVGAGNGRNADAAAHDSPQIRLRRDDTGAAPEAVIEWGGAARAGLPEDVFETFAGGEGPRPSPPPPHI